MDWRASGQLPRAVIVSPLPRPPYHYELIGAASAQGFCYEMKVTQAFSWALFAMFVIAFGILMQLVGHAERMGRHFIWREPIRGLFCSSTATRGIYTSIRATLVRRNAWVLQ